MPSSSQSEASEHDVLRAMLALQIADREERTSDDGGRRGTEVVLDAVGFNYSEIASLTGQDKEAVRSTVRREKEAAAKAKAKTMAAPKRKGGKKNG